MNALFDSLASAIAPLVGSPTETPLQSQSELQKILQQSRQAALEQALASGLPHQRMEAWKNTSLRALSNRRFVLSETAAIDSTVLNAIPSPRIVLINGVFSAEYSAFSELPAGVTLQPLSAFIQHADTQGDAKELAFLQKKYALKQDVFAQLNSALYQEGWVLQVDTGVTVETPIHWVNISTESPASAWHLHHLIKLNKHAAAVIVEHHISQGNSEHLGNSIAHIHIAEAAQLHHVRVQNTAARHTEFVRTEAVLAKDSQYRRVDLELGAGLNRHELNVRLEGNNAELTANGVLLSEGRQHLETRLGIEHIARDTRSQLIWRGLAKERSRIAFYGGIHIRQGADGTDAFLSNKNILFSEHAEINTQPVLIIDADEVKAAHGATVGQFDQAALFYLRSRGIPLEQAQQLLTEAFCFEPLYAAFTNENPLSAAALSSVLNTLKQHLHYQED